MDPPRRPNYESEPSYIQFYPRRAIASFDNLVALANHQERLKEARRIIWRDRGEPVTQLEDVYECFEHAGRGGLRAASLAFSVRAGINLVLALFRLKRVPRATRFAILRHAILGADSWRFAAMLGSFVYLYKFILNALPFAFPYPTRSASGSAIDDDEMDLNLTRAGMTNIDIDIAPNTQVASPSRPRISHARRNERLSLSASAIHHYGIVRKRTRRWHALVAGAIAGGLGVMFEKRDRRLTIGQQMFVRGLQAEWGTWAPKFGVHIPHGAVWMFSICCGQIMYAWLMRPDTLPRSYNSWILKASRVPGDSVKMNRTLVLDGNFDLDTVGKLINRKDITRNNRASLISRYSAAVAAVPDFGPRYGPCAAIHPWEDNCAMEQVNRFFSVFRWIMPVYTALHFIPMLLFKRNVVAKRPAAMLLRAALGTMRSSAFLGVFVTIYQTWLCTKENGLGLAKKLGLPTWLLDLVTTKPTFWMCGFLCGLSLFVEEPRRRTELAMYVLPKGMESAWLMARKRGYVFKTGKYGEALLTALGMGMVMSIYQNDPQHLSGLVRRILYQFVGPN